VTVNGNTANRHGEYFHWPLAVNNASALYTNISVISLYGGHETNSGYVSVPPKNETIVHDAEGNLVSDGLWTNTWDAENRLIGMESLVGYPTAGKRKLEFAYDAQGRRVQKIVSTNNGSAWVAQSTNRFVYDGWNLIAELGASHLPRCVYVWGLDLSGTPQGAGGVGGLVVRSEISGGTLSNACFVAYDGNGNVAALLNASSSSLTARYEYGPFAEPLKTTGSTARANPFRFSTKYQDDETDLIYYGFRYEKDGGWLSRDPIGESGGRNLTGFAGNNLITFVDYLGQLGFSEGVQSPGECGAFEWTIYWAIGAPQPNHTGSVVQHVGWVFRVKDCQSQPVDVDPKLERDGVGSEILANYWEAWDVNPKQTTTMPVGDSWKSAGFGDDTWGTIKITGIASYYPDTQIPIPPFAKNEPSPSNGLLWTTINPASKYPAAASSITRVLIAEWDCCCTMFPEKRKTKLTVSAE
jgi:RHS repeat-associated protein